MRVSPMVIEMESRGTDATARIEVQNINTGNLAFETRVFRMDIDADGVITETPADDDFLIFPPQGILPAGGRQVVRLQWLGAPEPDTSQAYYVSVEQLPVTLEPTPDVKAANVAPVFYQPPALPGAAEQPPMQEGVAITLRNDGRRHAMMSNFSWQLVGTNKEGKFLRVDLSPEELSRVIGTGFVPAQGERVFRLPVPGFGSGPIELSFKQ